MKRVLPLLLLVVAACASSRARPEMPATIPPIPDTTGFGTPVLALDRAPDGSIWAGTYGNGIFVLRPGAGAWESIAAVQDDSTSISWNYVNSFAFPADGSIWYGTVGNGFGRSFDGGRTWRNWTFGQLGPEWQYVAPGGIRSHGSSVFIATADGLRISSDAGQTWLCVQGVSGQPGGAAGYDDRCTERLLALPTEYLLAADVDASRTIWVGHLQGLSASMDGGRSWIPIMFSDSAPRVRAVRVRSGRVWVGTEEAVYVGDASGKNFRRHVAVPGGVRAFADWLEDAPLVATASRGLMSIQGGRLRSFAGRDSYAPQNEAWSGLAAGSPVPLAASGTGVGYPGRIGGPTEANVDAAAAPAAPLHVWFTRPIGSGGNPHIDATYRYGSTMGGNFQQHQGVEFNNPAGTPVLAAGAGTVVFADKAEAGANTVVVLHDSTWAGRHVFTTYFHNTSLDVEAGARVAPGDLIARVGNTGRATNDHLHFEVHVAPTTDVKKIVDPEVRFPPYTVNPQLWLEPLPGTGIVAGRVLDAAGKPVQGARVYGLVLPYPSETPFAFAETYRERAHADPAYEENFAVGDVPAGEYLLGTRIGEARVWRRVRVEPGRVTYVEFAPPR